MKRLRNIEPLLNYEKNGVLCSDFVRDVNINIDKINLAIDAYNNENPKRLETLKGIFLYRRQLESKYQGNVITVYREQWKSLQANLFNELQREAQGTHKLTSIASLVNPQMPPPAPNSLANLIENMSPEIALKLADILSKNTGNDNRLDILLESLYADKTGPEAKAFDAFKRNHMISYLGGQNSNNFLVTPLIGGKPQVLKLEYRMRMPKEIENHLRDTQFEALIPVYANRQVFITPKTAKSNPDNTRFLQVTDYCDGSDVLTYSKKGSYQDMVSHCNNAVRILGQMADILQSVEKRHCAIPDMKITNWLIDKNGRVLIADTKSFVYIEDDGTIQFLHGKNQLYNKLGTEGFLPPEFSTTNDPSGKIYAKQMHSYIFGINLLVYLTGSTNMQKGLRHPFFKQEPMGKALIELIIDLTHPIPGKRKSIEDAQTLFSKLEKNTIMCDFRPDITSSTSLDERMTAFSPYLDTSEKHSKLIAEVQHACISMIETLSRENPSNIHNREQINTLTADQLFNKYTVLKHEYTQILNERKVQSIFLLINLYQQHGLFTKDKFGNDVKDSPLDKEMQSIRAEIIAITNLNSFPSINAKITQLENKLNENKPKVQIIKDIITQYRTKAEEFFSIGMNDKANRIETALNRLTLEERNNLDKQLAEYNQNKLSDNVGPGVKQLVDALTSKRILTFYTSEAHKEEKTKSITTFYKDQLTKIGESRPENKEKMKEPLREELPKHDPSM